MADWFRKHLLEPAHNLETRLVHKVEDLGGFVVKRIYHGGQQLLHGFEAAGSTVVHRVTGAAGGAVVALDKGVHRGLQKVEGAASTVLHKVENAGTSAVQSLETATVQLARGINNGIIHPAVHAIEQPIENAWHGVENVAGKAWHGVEGVAGNALHAAAGPFRIMLYGGMLIGGYVFYQLLQDQREEQMVKRRRYR